MIAEVTPGTAASAAVALARKAPRKSGIDDGGEPGADCRLGYVAGNLDSGLVG